jgi:hypothetical protein
MVRAAEAVLLESALLVAVTVSEPALVGAVYVPDELIAPNAAVHVTDLSAIVPWTDDVNCFELPAATVAVVGETEIELTTGVDPGVDTVTLAEADFVLSATLVAVTVSVPAFAGAV